MPLFEDALFSLKPRCPQCQRGRLFRPWSLAPVEACDSCGEKLADYDVGDGASVFLIFFLGFTLVPAAWWLENAVHPPLWAHAVIFGIITLALIAIIMPAVKAYIILLEFRHRKKRS